MKKSIFFPILTFLIAIGFSINLSAQGDLLITGVFDGDLSGGLPKGVEIYVINDVADLSVYALSSANNGAGTTAPTPEFQSLTGSATAGEFIYLASENVQFPIFFGFAPDYVDATFNINGDDAIELFHTADGGTTWTVVDVFGDVDVDGTGQPWEYADGWAYRTTTTQSTTFNDGDWTYGSLVGESDNASAATPFPIGTFTLGGGCTASIPFFDGFEADQTDATALAGCWTQESVSGTATWMANSSLTSYNRTPRTGSFNAYLQYGNTDWIFYALDLTGGVSYTVKLYARQDVTTGATLKVAYGIAGDAASMTTDIIPSTAVINGNYQEFSGSFTPATSGTYYIGINGVLNYSPYYLSIDDFEVYESPTATLSWYNLQHPATATILTDETFEVFAQAWEDGLTNADAGAPGAGIECWIGYSDTDSDPSSWTNWVPAVYNVDDGNNDEFKAELGTFAAGTYYYASRWRLDGGPYTYGGYNSGAWDGTTNVSGVLTVNEPVITYINLPISEDFEAGLGNVILVNGAETNYWMTGSLASQTGDALYVTNDGTANAYSVGSASVSHAYIPVDFNGITNATLSFDWISDGENNYDFLKVYLIPESTVITAGTQLSAADQIGTIYQDGTAIQTPVITLSATEITQDQMKLVFSWRNDGSGGTMPPASVDNILLEEITCMEPTTIAAGNITATSADITWTASVLGETSWNIKVNATNTIDPTSADGDVVANDVVTTTPEYALSTLTAETDYYVYVQSACGSDWVEYMFTTPAACPVPTTLNAAVVSDDVTLTWDELGQTDWNIKIHPSALTNPDTETADIEDAITGGTGEYILNDLAIGTYYWYVQSDCGSAWADGQFYIGYCLPAPSSVDNSGITNVTFGQNVTVNNPTGTETNNYGDYSSMVGDGAQGLELTVAISYSTGYTYGTKIWVDWNNDLEFSDVDELMYTGLSSATNPTTLNASFIVPIATPLGQYRMRIGGTDNDDGPSNACYTGAYGSFEDYTLEVIAAPACFQTPSDLASSAITTEAATISWTAATSDPANGYQYYLATTATPVPDGATVATGATAYGEISVDLASLTEDTDYYIWVRSNCDDANFSDWVGPLNFTTLASCIVPSDLTATDITSTSATLGWTEYNGSSSWQIIVHTSPFDPENPPAEVTANGITSNPLIIPDGVLDPNTTYYWYIQTDCGGGTFSAWSAQGEFTTECEVYSTFPFVEEFEDGVPPSCWNEIRTPASSYGWISNTNGLTGSCARFDSWVNPNNNKSQLLTPIFDLTSLTNPVLEFSYKNATGGNFEVLLSTDGGSTYPNIIATGLTAQSNWLTVSYDISSYIGTNVKIALHGTSNYGSGDAYVYVDNFTIRDLSDENDILTFTLPQQTDDATIDLGNHTVNIEVSMGTDLSALTPTITVSENAEIDPLSGIVQDFTGSGVTPFEYTVTSESGIDQIWSVTVTVATTLSAQKDIETFELDEEVAPATIGANTVDITVNFMADVTNLTPTITISNLATISPDSGETQDFSSPVTYTVTAQDASTKDYVVTVTKESSPLGADCTNPYLVSLPADLTYEDLGQTTCGMGDVYNDLDIPDGAYDNGEDVIYEIEVTADSYVRMTLDPKTTTYTAIAIFDDCPDSGTILNGEYGYTAGLKSFDIALTTGTYYVAIDMATYNDDCIPEYDFTIEEICPEVTDIEEVNLTATSADIQWIETGFATAWNIKVNSVDPIADPSTTDGNIVTIENVSSTTYTIPATLTAETDYYVYVQSDCGSEWVEYMFTTPAACPVPTGLFADVVADDVTLSWNALGVSDWVLQVSTTDISADPSVGGDIENNTAVTPNPEFTLTDLATETTYYWYVQSTCGSAWASGEFYVGYCLSTGTNSSYYINNFETTGGSDNISNLTSGYSTNGYEDATSMIVSQYETGTVNFDASFVGGTFGFGVWVDWNNDMDFDDADENVYLSSSYNSTYSESFNVPAGTPNGDYRMRIVANWSNTTPSACNGSGISGETEDYTFTVIDMPTCMPVTDLFADNITTTSADLNWTDVTGSGNFYIKVNKDVSIDPTSADGDIVVNEATSDMPYTSLTTLEPATTYYFYVQADCGGGDFSNWSEGMFTTECEVYTIPHFEGFEDGDMPICWTILNEDGDLNEWGIGNGDGDPYEGAQTASISFNSSGNDDWLISPQFNISNINTVVDFYAMSRSSFYPEDFNVLLSTTGNSTSDFTIVLENIIDHPDTWELHSYLLSDYGITEGQNIYVAIQSISVDEWNLYIDAFSIHELPQIDEIDINSDAVDVEVCQGTLEADAIAALATQITITDTDAAEHVVDLSWTIASYDANTPADYTATGTFALPVGVVQSDPVTPLEVTALVTVTAPVEPTFSFETEYCLNSTADALPTISDNGIEGAWAPSTIATDVAGPADYIFTPLTGECGTGTTISVTINDLPVVTCPETVNVAVDEPVTFTGQDPVGGTFSGTGVVGDTFDPNGLANDTYVITYTYTDPVTGCENSCDFDVIVDIDINVADVTVEGIGIYPNPNNGEFVINFNNIEGNVTYQLYDTKGSTIILKDISTNGNTVEEISVDLVPGVYYVKVVTAAQTYVEKLVVE